MQRLGSRSVTRRSTCRAARRRNALSKLPTMTNEHKPPIYYVVFCVLKYRSFAEAETDAPESIAAHINRSKDLHASGALVMAGAFLDKPDEPLSTMGVLT